jgi:hypothetical protein
MLIDTVRCRNKNEVHSWVNSISKEYESKREHHRYARWAAVRAEYRSRQCLQMNSSEPLRSSGLGGSEGRVSLAAMSADELFRATAILSDGRL